MINLITAVSIVPEGLVIGKGDTIPWFGQIHGDLRQFREQTTGNIVIMGRKTFDSIPLGSKPLKKRDNYVISTNQTFHATYAGIPDLYIFDSLQSAIDAAEHEAKKRNKEIYIMGGQGVYEQTLDKADHLYLTIIGKAYHGDIFFPANYTDYFKEVKREEKTSTEGIPLTFLTFDKKD